MASRRGSRSGRSKIMNIAVTGYWKIKEPQKHHVFVIDITWNNGERYESYRRYSDFFNFQTTLQAIFPDFVGRGNEDKTIPRLPKRSFILRSQVTRVTEAKLEQFNRYCQTIITLDPRISESQHVITFFTPRGGDKQLPTVKLRRSSATLQPKSREERRAESKLEEHRALTDFTAEDPSQVSFNKGDRVYVKSRDKSGWWLCKVNGNLGWAPSTYLKSCTDDSETELSSDSHGYVRILSLRDRPVSRNVTQMSEDFENDHDTHYDAPKSSKDVDRAEPENAELSIAEITAEISAEEYKAIDSYTEDGPGQVTFVEGDIIHVLDKLEDGWWFVRVGEEEGWAPCGYIEKLNGEDDEEIIPSNGIQKYYSVEDYEADEDDEISFTKGEVLTVMQKRLDGWWLVEYKDKIGLAPGTLLKEGLPPEPEEQSEEEETSPPQVAQPNDEDKEVNLLYENIQLQMIRPQPPRRKSVRHWAAEKRRPGTKTTLTTVSELNEGEVPLEGAKDYSASTCSALYSQGREQNEVKTYDTTSETHFLKAPLPNEEEHSTNGTPRPPIPAPRTRIRNKNSASSSEEKAQVDPPRPKIKARSKSVEKPKVNSSLPSPSPIQVTTPDSLLTTNEIDEPPSPGSSHPSMPDMHQPRLPPRPTPSVYKRAKECAKLNNSDCGSVSSWPEYTQHSRPRQKMKKAKSQTHADERFQELRPHRQVVRMRSANDTNEDLYSTRETRTQNQEVGGATGGGENPFSEEMTGQLLKYILASPDPTLKATLKSLITNNEAIKDSLQ